MNNIEIRNLTKRYKNGIAALEDVSFTVGGGVFGLLGHNGAGKTTAFFSGMPKPGKRF